LGHRGSRDEKNNPDQGLFFVPGSIFFFLLFIP
jgi:hypothetical protein